MTDKEKITTQPYRLTPATYFKIAAGAKLPSIIASAILLLFISAVAAVLFDLRILLIGLIAVFLILPFLVLHIYYNILLTSSARFALSRKTVTFNSDGSMTETFLPITDDDSADNRSPLSPHTHSADSITSIRRTSRFMIFTIEPNYQLIIPLNSIADHYLLTEEIFL